MSIQIYRFDPLTDPRWAAFIQDCDASVFHTPAWMEALRRTYGYQPTGFTCSPPSEPIDNAIIYCRVYSWLTGRRLVSLPFSDHCQPLATSPEKLSRLIAALIEELRSSSSRYVEIRPHTVAADMESRFELSGSFCSHLLDLSPPIEEIFRGFHKDCVQRKIRRAEREGLKYEVGSSESLLSKFYHLLVMTRRRHGLPAQPLDWFRNLIDCMENRLAIHVALKDDAPVASILTLRHSRTLTYKYGGSDAKLHNLGGMQMLLWKAIQDAKSDGVQQMDMGRSDSHNFGLIEFKKRWGATEADLHYLRYPMTRGASVTREIAMGVAGQLLTVAPPRLLTLAARLAYKHLGCL